MKHTLIGLALLSSSAFAGDNKQLEFIDEDLEKIQAAELQDYRDRCFKENDTLACSLYASRLRLLREQVLKGKEVQLPKK